MVLYFAYGRNMNEYVMRERGVVFTSSERAVLKGYKLIFNDADDKNGKTRVGYANVIKDPKSNVIGVLYEIRTGLKNLDEYEGVPINYIREFLKIEINGKCRSVEIYIAIRTSGGLKPEKEYLNDLITGAKQHGFPKHYVDFLKNVKTAD
jgi:gamma-glutamylcyclotransferase (GGCT)/AIG2-like uncharacterized protein YtfP